MNDMPNYSCLIPRYYCNVNEQTSLMESHTLLLAWSQIQALCDPQTKMISPSGQQARPKPMCFSLKLHKSKMSNYLIEVLNTYPSSSNQYTECKKRYSCGRCIWTHNRDCPCPQLQSVSYLCELIFMTAHTCFQNCTCDSAVDLGYQQEYWFCGMIKLKTLTA